MVNLIQSAQLLNQESGFYQNLFQGYSSLTTGNDFLQLMNFKLNATGANLLDPLEQASRLCQQVLAEQLSRNAVSDRTTIQRIRSLETLIGHLGTAVQTFQKNAAQSLAEVYANINQLSITARSASIENTHNPAGAFAGLTSTQAHELARLTEGFAREVTGLAQSLHRMTEEMRASLAPFRLDTTQSSQQVNPITEPDWQGSRASHPVTEPGWRSRQQPNPVTKPDWLKGNHRNSF